MAVLKTKRKRGRPSKDPRKAKAQVVRIRKDGKVAKKPTAVGRAEVEAWLDRNQANYDRVAGRKRAGQITVAEACCEALGITKRTYQRHVVAITKRRKAEALHVAREQDPMLAAMAKAMISRSVKSTTATAAPSATAAIHGAQNSAPYHATSKNQAPKAVGIPPKIDLATVHQELVRATTESADRGLLVELDRAIQARLTALGSTATTVAGKGPSVEKMAIEGLVGAICDYLDLVPDSSATGQTVARNLKQIEAWLRSR